MDLSIRTETFGQSNQSWLGSAHGTSNARPCTLDVSAFTAGTHYPAGYFPSGLALGKITATGLYGPYDDSKSDGTQTLVGFLLDDVKASAVNTIDVQGALFEHGRVIVANLPIPSSVDAAGKTDLKGQIIFV